MATLALSTLPTRDLAALYAGLIERTEALAVARMAGRSFRLADSAEQHRQWRNAIAQSDQVSAEIAMLSVTIRKQNRLATKVESGEKVRLLKASLDKYRSALE